MGYTLQIGELVVEYVQDESEPRIEVAAKGFHRDDAPAFGEPTDGESQRWPSYTSWREFTEFVGLHCLFYGSVTRHSDCIRDDHLIQEHPGCVPITERHRRDVNKALADYKERFPDATPSYGRPPPEGTHPLFWEDKENPEENSWMCRLVWLHYWINWALDNCKKPVFQNT